MWLFTSHILNSVDQVTANISSSYKWKSRNALYNTLSRNAPYNTVSTLYMYHQICMYTIIILERIYEQEWFFFGSNINNNFKNTIYKYIEK